MPRPENDAPVPSHGTTPDPGGGFTDPAPGREGIIVQGGRTPSGSNDPRAIGPKQDDPRAIGPKQDDPRAIGPKQDDPRAIGPKQDDPRAIGPKQDDPRAIGPKQDDPRAIGPKQDDPRAIGPKHDDPHAVRDGIIVQGGRTGHPGGNARQKRARKTKTMALVIGGVMVLAVGGFLVGRQLGHDPATLQPQAVATPTAAVSGGAPAPSASSDGGSPAPPATPGAPATEVASSPTPAASEPPARNGSGPTPARSTA
ncbi:hypothetical protein VR44_34925, partial [Streptomyces katrae]